jgi:hypothetical protein
VARSKAKTVIGHTALIRFLDRAEHWVIAKVDTGADLSSVWASSVREQPDGTLAFILFGPKSHYYSGETIMLPKAEYRKTSIANSFGVKEERYVVKLRVEIQGRIIRATFTLADRSLKAYPVLIGKRALNGKFIVDVSKRA